MASFTLHIQFVDRPPETRTFTGRDTITVGRDVGDIALRDSQVSGRHGELTFQGGVLRYNDTGSTNGSFLLDGRQVTTIELTPGMAVRVGNSLLTVQMIDSPHAGKGRTMIAGAGVAPFGMPMQPPGGATPPGGAPAGMPPAGMPPPGGMTPPAGLPPPGTLSGGGPAATPPAGGQDLAYAPTSAMPAAIPGGFIQPVAQPPGAPPPGFPKPTPVAPPAEAAGPAPGATPPGPAHPPVPVASGGFNFDEVIAHYKQAWEFVRPVLQPAALIIGALTVPIALVSGLLGWIPFVGWILSALLGLAEFALLPLALAALTRFLLGVYLQQPIDWIGAWKQQIPNFLVVWLSFFVAGLIAGIGTFFLIIPGIALGSFIGAIYFCEGKRMADINLRNLDLIKADPVLPIVAFLVAALGLGIVLAIPLAILGMIPFIGGLLAGVLGAAYIAVVAPFMVSLSIHLYFRLRRSQEGGEPEIAAAQMLLATSAALNQAPGSAPAAPPPADPPA